MGYNTTARGTITITPPILWGAIKDSPFLPNNLDGDNSLDVALVIGESEVDTEQGVLHARVATGVEQRYEGEARNYDIVEHLQQLLDTFPGHTFTGRFDCEGEENGDMWRLKVVDRRAVRFDPVLVWPAESEHDANPAVPDGN